MANTPFDIAKNQAESAAKNRLRAEEAAVRREGSIVKLAGELMAKQGVAAQGKGRAKSQKSGVYVSGGDQAGSAPVTVSDDGYVRRSPVQELRVAPGYKKRIAVHIVVGVVAALAIGFAIYMILGYIF